MRLDILKMAQQMLESDRQSQIQASMTKSHDEEWVPREQVIQAVESSRYTTEDIINKADELYSFVNGNDIKKVNKK